MRLSIVLVLTIWMSAVVPSYAAQFYGGYGLIHTNAAKSIPDGALDGNLFVRGFYTTVQGAATTNATSVLAFNYGLTKNIELGITQILYQDLNLTIKRNETSEIESTNIPGDTYLRFKYGGYELDENTYLGAISAVRYRTATWHDVHLEPYQSEGIEGELTLLASRYWRPLHPNEDKQLHINIGYINHNDAEKGIGSAAQELTYLIAMLFPRGRANFGFEIYGSSFIANRPVKWVLSREDWLYVTPLLRYYLYPMVTLDVGMDFLILGSEETTSRPYEGALKDYPNYSEWRLSMRVNYTPYNIVNIQALERMAAARRAAAAARRSQSGSASPRGSGGAVGGQYYDSKSLFRWAVEDRMGNVEMSELEIEKLRQERIKSEEDLKRLKRKLETKKRETGK